MDDRLLSDIDAAYMLGVARGRPWKMAAAGTFPKPIKIGPRCTRWRLSDVQAWIADPQAWRDAQAEVK